MNLSPKLNKEQQSKVEGFGRKVEHPCGLTKLPVVCGAATFVVVIFSEKPHEKAKFSWKIFAPSRSTDHLAETSNREFHAMGLCRPYQHWRTVVTKHEKGRCLVMHFKPLKVVRFQVIGPFQSLVSKTRPIDLKRSASTTWLQYQYRHFVENCNEGPRKTWIAFPTTNTRASFNRIDSNSSDDTRRCCQCTILLVVTNPVSQGSSWTWRRFGVQHHCQSLAMKRCLHRNVLKSNYYLESPDLSLPI